MSIIRCPQRRYTSVANELLRDTSLSFACRGMLAYLLSHTDNWECRASDIEREGKMGTQARRTLMKEAEIAGYLSFHKDRNHLGQVVSRYDLHEEPLPPAERTKSWENPGTCLQEPPPAHRGVAGPGLGEPGPGDQGGIHETELRKTELRKTERRDSPFDSFEPVDTPATTEERLWGELTPLEATVLEITGEQSRSWAVIAKAKEAAAALANLGLTVADLHEFDRQRSKTCKLNFLASEVGAWWRDKSKRAAPRPPVNIREKYTDSVGTRFVILTCNWQDTLHVQEVEDVEAAEAVGRALDAVLKGSDWDPLSPKGFADFWRNECQHTSVITPATVRKYFGQYRDWVKRQKAA